jgi:hypothetical protein
MGIVDTAGVVSHMIICGLRVWQWLQPEPEPRSATPPGTVSRSEVERLFAQAARDAMVGAQVSPSVLGTTSEAITFVLPFNFRMPRR